MMRRRNPTRKAWQQQQMLAEEIPPGVRIHMSGAKIPKLLPMEPPVGADDKPEVGRGFWYDLNGEWIAWTGGNRFRFGRFYYAVEVDLSRVLCIRDADQFDAFEEEYKTKPPIRRMMDGVVERLAGMELDEQERKFVDAFAILTSSDGLINSHTIDWGRVAEKYGGIEIAPGLPWRFRTRSKWYYTWDCASGVIWDVNAITGIELFAVWDAKRKLLVKFKEQDATGRAAR